MNESPSLQAWYPIVDHRITQIGRMADVSGTGRRGPVYFEQDIFWLRHCEARISFVHGGKTLLNDATYSDVRNDFLGCIRNAIQKCHVLAESFSVTNSSSLSIVMSAMVLDEPCLRDAVRPETHNKGTRWDAHGRFSEIPDDWFYEDEISRAILAGRHPGGELMSIRRVKPVCVAHAENLWSSARSPARNAAMADHFIATQKAAAETAARDCQTP